MYPIFYKNAKISNDKLYRYTLQRRWHDTPQNEKNTCLFLLMNPSTADETKDDPTLRRLIGYAQNWNYDGLILLNLFALRTTNPKNLISQKDPIGPENIQTLQNFFEKNYPIICGFGIPPKPIQHEIPKIFKHFPQKEFHALKLNKNGWPAHPLYLKKDLKPFIWNPRECFNLSS